MRNIPLPPPSNEVVEYVRASTGVNEQRIKEAVKILKNWLKLQPHLPHDYGKLYQRLIDNKSLHFPEIQYGICTHISCWNTQNRQCLSNFAVTFT